MPVDAVLEDRDTSRLQGREAALRVKLHVPGPGIHIVQKSDVHEHDHGAHDVGGLSVVEFPAGMRRARHFCQIPLDTAPWTGIIGTA